MKFQNVIFLTALLLASITCIRKMRKEEKNIFQEASKVSAFIFQKTEELGHKFFDAIEDKDEKGVPVEDFAHLFLDNFGPKIGTNHLLSEELDLNNNGFVDREESGVAFRNIIVSLGLDVIAKGLEYSAPEGEFSEAIDQNIEKVAEGFEHVKERIDQLYDAADESGKGRVTAKEFVELLRYPYLLDVPSVLEKVVSSGEERINKIQAFYIFELLILDSHNHEHSHEEEEEEKESVATPQKPLEPTQFLQKKKKVTTDQEYFEPTQFLQKKKMTTDQKLLESTQFLQKKKKVTTDQEYFEPTQFLQKKKMTTDQKLLESTEFLQKKMA
jgi:hypothetical protein